MALTHLVDTSVLVRLDRPTVRAVLRPLADSGRIGRAGISDLEVGFSARTASEWDSLHEAMAVFQLIETDARHLRRARMSRGCARWRQRFTGASA